MSQKKDIYHLHAVLNIRYFQMSINLSFVVVFRFFLFKKIKMNSSNDVTSLVLKYHVFSSQTIIHFSMKKKSQTSCIDTYI